MTGTVAAFPWQEVMRFGLGVLAIPPDAFWRTTPREMAAAIEARLNTGPRAPDRSDLERLMTAFPDLSDDNDQTGDRNAD